MSPVADLCLLTRISVSCPMFMFLFAPLRLHSAELIEVGVINNIPHLFSNRVPRAFRMTILGLGVDILLQTRPKVLILAPCCVQPYDYPHSC